MASRQKRLLELKRIKLQLDWISKRLDEVQATMNMNCSNSCAFLEKQELMRFNDTEVQVPEDVFSNSSSSPDLEIDWDSPPIFDDYLEDGYLIQNISTLQPPTLENVGS